MKQLSKGIYPGLICAIMIMILMGLPGTCFPTVVSFWDWLSPDKILHIILFSVLSFISIWGYRNDLLKNSKPYRIKIFIVVLVATISYGGLTELLQKYVFFNRYGCIFDFLADTIGCILGTSIYFIYQQKKIKKIKQSDDNI